MAHQGSASPPTEVTAFGSPQPATMYNRSDKQSWAEDNSSLPSPFGRKHGMSTQNTHLGNSYTSSTHEVQHASSQPQQANRRRWPWSMSAEEKRSANLESQFNGKRGWNGYFYRKPVRPADPERHNHAVLHEDDYGGALKKDTTGKFKYLNQFGQESTKYSDVAVYLSPTNFVPRRLVVQATEHVLKNRLDVGDWRRRGLNGDVPSVLGISEWALSPFAKKRWWNKLDGSLRLLAVAIPLQLYLAWPGTGSWDDEDVEYDYTDFPGYHWQWPKHAINLLDRKPAQKRIAAHNAGESKLNGIPSVRYRMIKPRQIVMLQPDNTWKVESSTPDGLKYVFISYADKSFSSESGRRLIKDMAAAAALQAGCKAYWLDFMCRASKDEPELLDSDVYHMCDVIRGCTRVVVMLPDSTIASKKNWGARMWTLPEALLAPAHSIDFCTPDGEGQMTETLSLIEMTSQIWDDPESAEMEDGGGPTRLLAEHYCGLLTLSPLERFSVALEALQTRSEIDYRFFTLNDVTYALMGLMHYRIERDDTDRPFQSLAQLSLRNDNDRIVERMVSLYPHPGHESSDPFRTIAQPDLFHTHLWDIEPTCQVVGVAYENNTVLLDSCRAMHIRWKGFPRMVVARDWGMRKLLATVFVTAGTWWFLQGVTLAVYYAPIISDIQSTSKTLRVIEWMIAGFLFIAVLLSIFGPFSVRRLYGGQVLQSASNLVGFEGVMPINQLEKILFGNSQGRLSYEASSSPYAEYSRDPNLRVGLEPEWIRDGPLLDAESRIPKGHKLFTLVDTGELSVSIFSAERPPTVALLCGREGGMLRAVLCSWQFENDCLYKEAVLRMPTNVWEAASPKGWLKVCLGTLDRERESERAYKVYREAKAAEKEEKKKMHADE